MYCHTASHPPYLHPSLAGNIFGNFWKKLGYFLFHALVTLHHIHTTYTHPLLASNAVQIIREACFCHSKVEKFLSLNFFSTFEDATTMMACVEVSGIVCPWHSPKNDIKLSWPQTKGISNIGSQ